MSHGVVCIWIELADAAPAFIRFAWSGLQNFHRAHTLLKHEGTESENVATFPQRARHETMAPTPAFYFFLRGTQDERLQESLSHDNVFLGGDEIADLRFIIDCFPDTFNCSATNQRTHQGVSDGLE